MTTLLNSRYDVSGRYKVQKKQQRNRDDENAKSLIVLLFPPPLMYQTCTGDGCETSKFRACNCVGMVSEDGSKKMLPAALDDATIEKNIKLVSGRGGTSMFLQHSTLD